jgi:nucleotide-binding universal stress UspA family protein
MIPVIERIVVPTNFTSTSDAALDYAAVLALPLWASVHLLHVLQEPFLSQGPGEFYIPDLPALREQMRRDAESRLSRLRVRFVDRCAKVTTETRFGGASEQIIAAANDHDAHLIVMGTHGRRGAAHFVHGSVTERVMRGARCPVLAVQTRPAHVGLRQALARLHAGSRIA